MSASKPPRPAVVALRYDRERSPAPTVVAKGSDELAQRILAIARENGVPVREDADLLRLLAACELGDEIPTELFSAVAGLLAYLYELNGELGGKRAA